MALVVGTTAHIAFGEGEENRQEIDSAVKPQGPPPR